MGGGVVGGGGPARDVRHAGGAQLAREGLGAARVEEDELEARRAEGGGEGVLVGRACVRAMHMPYT